ncbi:carbonic anhydrase 4 [Ascaphus truei]|uniref:carbonic anhydrase 4 n=1 Tax=Ascaphus truei TaxID=8439 RepID=UPI003F596CCB
MTFLSLVLLLCLWFHKVTAEASWCYESQEECPSSCHGPKKWKDHYNQCGMLQQSPINIVTKKTKYDAQLKPFEFIGYNVPQFFKITNDGHSVKVVDLSADIKIKNGGLSSTYTASQFHFHWGNEDIAGSEHTIDGEQFPMELHIVHKITTKSDGGETDGLAVLGFMYEVSTENNNKYNSIIDALTNIPVKDNTANISSLMLQDLIPDKKLDLYYRYKGSLTTPDCNETVTWTLFNETIKLSKTQLRAFYTKLNFSTNTAMVENFRPVQKLGNRTVYTSEAGAVLSQNKTFLITLIVSYLVIAS